MSSIGPQLPAHLTKRKRTPEDEDGADPSSPPNKQQRGERPAKNNDEIDLDGSDSDDSDNFGPPRLPAGNTAVGPTLPPNNNDEIGLDSEDDSDAGPQPPVTGPQPPQQNDDANADSDSEDDYGPPLPSASTAPKPSIGPSLPPSEPTPQRDTWMLAPPSSSSSYTERDPTRMRSRKFASKPSTTSSAATGGVSSIWTETPEEKLRRLQDSVLGRESRSSAGGEGGQGAAAREARTREQEERDRKIAASVEAHRGRSLYEDHQSSRKEKGSVTKGEEDDDPSKRAFDREKDMALGGKIGTAQRRDLMNKSANFGGRFQKGSFL